MDLTALPQELRRLQKEGLDHEAIAFNTNGDVVVLVVCMRVVEHDASEMPALELLDPANNVGLCSRAGSVLRGSLCTANAARAHRVRYLNNFARNGLPLGPCK